ncbi:MAG: hypothetical protein IJ087_15365 [Eggerthellaceae bacterium]|nr:hypothetical protein [Eggerthellaceae bacterium]
MLPKKAIIAVIAGSLLLLGYQGLSEEKMSVVPNLLLGFALVGAIHAIGSLKDFKSVL